MAEAIRNVAADGAVELRLRLVGEDTGRAPMLIGDPLTGVFWPVPAAGTSSGHNTTDGDTTEGDTTDGDAVAAELRSRAQHLWWLCWEMGFDAVCEPTAASAVDAVLDAVASGCEVLVVAGADTRRWRATMRELARQAQRNGAEVVLACDRRPGPLLRRLAR